MDPLGGRRGQGRTSAAAAVPVLVVEAGLAVLGTWFSCTLTAEYGDVTELAAEDWRSRLASSVDAVVLVLVVATALVAVAVATQRWARLLAVAIPLLTVVAMLALTPAALRHKLATQYSDTPQCATGDETGAGPGADAVRDSQQAFESVAHVGHFSGGGGSGVVGCDRPLLLIEDADVLGHYRSALPAAGWRLVAQEERYLRAEREHLAFEVVVCGRGGIVWAGSADLRRGGARCPPEY